MVGPSFEGPNWGYPPNRFDFFCQILIQYRKSKKQAGAELGQAQVKLDDIVEVVVDVELKGVVKVEV